MKTRVSGDSGAQEYVARGLEQASLRGLSKGPPGAFLEGQDTRDRRLNGNSEKNH